MKYNIQKIIILITTTFLVVSCGDFKSIQHKIDTEYNKTQLISNQKNAKIYIKVNDRKDSRLSKTVNVLAPNTSIILAIKYIDKNLSVLADSGVNLRQRFDINFKNKTLAEYLNYLEDLTGYSFELSNNVINVKSIIEKTWNLSTLSMSGVGKNKTNSWSSIVDNVKRIVENIRSASNSSDNKALIARLEKQLATGKISTDKLNLLNRLKKESSDNYPVTNLNPIVLDNQQLGEISVIASPNKIKQVDSWLRNLIDTSNLQVHLKVQVLDVEVDEGAGRGINWDLVSNQSSKVTISNNAQQTIDGAGIFAINSALDFGKSLTLGTILNLLEKQGKVKVTNQPNITVTNGREATISTGDEFSYVSSIESSQDQNGNVVKTSNIERLKVGVEMSVTPKVLDDDRVVINVVPVISSVKSFSTLGGGGTDEEFQTPNIALQELATQVIVKSGETVHLGGLIASKVADSAKGLPGGFLDFLFQGVQKSFERREIVILITPTIIK